ncbi:GGDEF domain-containing protein [Alishewanella longhuensis]|uniref:diguanylate cyclase n=1 Tax=Alishewanella longhuensis TaxID=1091037 RepID=A0ABQ3KWY2_9ALTE|nr:diguanylate cyclase [Alishewanella longhuensis]GHG61033.1 GGDEF domain-containing protein [Alishewanella longhuensis]
MDVFTLTVVNAFIAVVVTAVLAFQNKAERQFRYQRYFMLAALCTLLNAIFSMIHYVGEPLPYWLSPALTNTLSVGAHIALAAGIHRHLQLSGKRIWLLLVFLAIYILHFTDFALSHVANRMLIAIPTVILLNFWCMQMLWQHRRNEHGKVYLAFIATFAFNIMQFSLRSAYMALEHYQLLQTQHSAVIYSIGFFSLTAFAILIFGCIIMLSHSQQQQALLKLSERDPLTGLLNRRSLELRLAGELNRAARTQTPVSLLLMDIDHFKQVNDTLGHAAGDLAIKHIADLTTELSRDYDVIFRFGGEEFLICLPNTEPETAKQIANRIRQTIEQHPLLTPAPLSLTVSIGVASSKHAIDWQDLLQHADEALYQAKHLGRNCVQSYN